MAVALDEKTCAQIRTLWESTALRPGEIARRLGLHVLTVSNLIRSRGWQRPLDVAPRPAAAPARSRPGKRRRAGSIRMRVMRLVDRNLDFLEEQMDDPDGMRSPEQRERVTKALETSTRMLDKLDDKGPHEQRAGADANDKPEPWSAAELERRRHEIAARLERIIAEQDAAAGARPADE